MLLEIFSRILEIKMNICKITVSLLCPFFLLPHLTCYSMLQYKFCLVLNLLKCSNACTLQLLLLILTEFSTQDKLSSLYSPLPCSFNHSPPPPPIILAFKMVYSVSCNLIWQICHVYMYLILQTFEKYCNIDPD